MYVELRQVVLTRLTLLNARRGSEPARMLIKGGSEPAWMLIKGGSEPAWMLIKDFEERHSWIGTTKLSSDDAAAMDKYSLSHNG